MPTWIPTPAQQRLLDSLRGHRTFMAFPHPTRPGWVELSGCAHLAGVTVATTLDVLRLAREHAANVASELLEAQKELTRLEPLHLVNLPSGETDCGLDAWAPGGRSRVPVTLSRSEATCRKCLGEKPSPELRISPELVSRAMGQQHDVEAVVSVDPGANSIGFVLLGTPNTTAEEPDELGQVDAFLMGVAALASATRDLAEAQAAVDRCSSGDGEEAVEKLIEEVTAKLRERVKLLDVRNGEA